MIYLTGEVDGHDSLAAEGPPIPGRFFAFYWSSSVRVISYARETAGIPALHGIRRGVREGNELSSVLSVDGRDVITAQASVTDTFVGTLGGHLNYYAHRQFPRVEGGTAALDELIELPLPFVVDLYEASVDAITFDFPEGHPAAALAPVAPLKTPSILYGDVTFTYSMGRRIRDYLTQDLQNRASRRWTERMGSTRTFTRGDRTWSACRAPLGEIDPAGPDLLAARTGVAARPITRILQRHDVPRLATATRSPVNSSAPPARAATSTANPATSCTSTSRNSGASPRAAAGASTAAAPPRTTTPASGSTTSTPWSTTTPGWPTPKSCPTKGRHLRRVPDPRRRRVRRRRHPTHRPGPDRQRPCPTR